MKHVFKTLLGALIVILFMISGKKDVLAQSPRYDFNCMINSTSSVINPSRLHLYVDITPGAGYVVLENWMFLVTEEPGGIPTFSYKVMPEEMPVPYPIIVPEGRAIRLELVSSVGMRGIYVYLHPWTGPDGLTTLSWIDAMHVY